MEVQGSIWKYWELYENKGKYMESNQCWKSGVQKIDKWFPPPLAKGQLFQPKFTNLMST